MLVPPRRRAIASAEGRDSETPLTIKARPGRPMKRKRDLKVPRSVRIQQEQQLHHKLAAELAEGRQPSRLSPLEALPVELIQQIFFHSLEVNLPRASPHLATVLSNPSIYSALILFAYFDDDEESPVEKQLFLPAAYRCLDLEDKVALQKSILTCRWLTLDLLKSSMPSLSRLRMVQAWHREDKSDVEQYIMDERHGPRDYIRVDKVLQPFAPLPLSVTDLDALDEHFLAKVQPTLDGDLRSTGGPLDSTPSDFRQCRSRIRPLGSGNYLPWIMEWTTNGDSRQPVTRKLLRASSILGVRCIPDHILVGQPLWTDSKLELLMLLRQGARFVIGDYTLEISVDALFEGMSSAIRAQNTRALLVLLELHFEVMGMETPPHWHAPLGSISVRFTHPIPLELFHLACAQPYPASSELLSLLLREGIDSVPDEDAVLTAWGVRYRSSDAVARFLLRHMEDRFCHLLKRGRPLFINGARAHWNPRAECPFPRLSFSDQLGYLPQLPENHRNWV